MHKIDFKKHVSITSTQSRLVAAIMAASVFLSIFASVGVAYAVVPASPVLSGSTGFTWNVLRWSEVSGATSYTLSRDGTGIYTGTSPSFTDSSLTSGTQYSYTVVATDSDGNSPVSNDVILTPNLDTGITTHDINLIGLFLAMLVAFYSIKVFAFKGGNK